MSDQIFINNQGGKDEIIILDSNPVLSIEGKTGNVYLTKSDVGLDQVDNTSDLNKPLSNAVIYALNSLSAFDTTPFSTLLNTISGSLTPLTLTYSISSNILSSVASAESYAEGLVSNVAPLFPLGSCYYASGGTGENPAQYQVKDQAGVLIGYLNLSWDGTPLLLIGVHATDAGGTPLPHGTFAMYYDGSGNLTSAVCMN